MRRLLPILMLSLAACGGGSAPTANEAAASSDSGQSEAGAVDAYVAEQQSARAMTGIDAATGDADRMPADFTGVTAGQIAARNRERERAAHDAMEQALDAAQDFTVNLPDPIGGGEVAGGETSVVESD